LVIKLIAGWLAISTTVIILISLIGAPPITRAVLLMGSALVVVWALKGGISSLILHDRIRNLILGIKLDWRLKFDLFATLLVLIEVATTTSLTNLAPIFGVPIGAAYKTASSNYLDVVFLHSVIVFISIFIGWAVLLHRFTFSPNAVLL
jgi:hypothetical protein